MIILFVLSYGGYAAIRNLFKTFFRAKTNKKINNDKFQLNNTQEIFHSVKLKKNFGNKLCNIREFN